MKKLGCCIALFLILAPGVFRSAEPDKPALNYLDGGYIEAKGLGLPPNGVDPKTPQAYTSARRAARVDMYRAVAEAVSTIHIDSETKVANNQTLMDEIKTAIQTELQLQNAQLVSETSLTDFIGGDTAKRGFVEVVLRVPLTGSGGVYSTVMPLLQPSFAKRDAALTTFTPAVLTVSQPTTQRTSAPAPAESDFDGLIIRVPGGFQPTPAPRIFSDDGKVVYSPKDIPLDILNNRGAAQYTNNEDKARNALKRFGSSNPLVMNGSMRTDTDAQLKNDDAAKVYNANKRSQFLNNAKVVFLIAS
jgi:hypothetical protein